MPSMSYRVHLWVELNLHLEPYLQGSLGNVVSPLYPLHLEGGWNGD